MQWWSINLVGSQFLYIIFEIRVLLNTAHYLRSIFIVHFEVEYYNTRKLQQLLLFWNKNMNVNALWIRNYHIEAILLLQASRLQIICRNVESSTITYVFYNNLYFSHFSSSFKFYLVYKLYNLTYAAMWKIWWILLQIGLAVDFLETYQWNSYTFYSFKTKV